MLHAPKPTPIIRQLFLIALIFVATLSLATCDKGSHHFDTIEHAVADAGQHNRHVLVEFQADWCSSCRKLRQKLQSPSLQPTLATFNRVMVDCTESTDATAAKMAQYNVEDLPVLLILDGEGRERARIIDENIDLKVLNDRLKNAVK